MRRLVAVLLLGLGLHFLWRLLGLVSALWYWRKN